MEFNDSRVCNFKLSDLEEECFGSKEDNRFSRFDNDYESLLSGKGAKFSIDKCAYILVYEKVQKKPISITFTPDNMHEKETVLSNIKPGVDLSKVEILEDGSEKMELGFYDFNSYMSPDLSNEIKQDNFKFTIEQHVYSKEFLNFMAGVSEYKEIGEFNPFMLPDKIYREPIADNLKQAMKDSLTANLRFLMDVFTKTEDSQVNKINQVVTKYSDNICKLLSVCHEEAMPILRNMILPHIQSIVGVLVDCPEAPVRKSISDVIGHSILVALNSTGIEISESDSSESSEEIDDMTDEDVIKTTVLKLLQIFKREKKDTTYKKLKGFFRMWGYLAKGRDDLLLWLVKEHKFVEKLLSKIN